MIDRYTRPETKTAWDKGGVVTVTPLIVEGLEKLIQVLHWRGMQYHNMPCLIQDMTFGKLLLNARDKLKEMQARFKAEHGYGFAITTILTANTLDNLAMEFRQLQRTECGELHEPFTSTQQGSSCMPHKKNPILNENICGLSRIVRSYAVVPELLEDSTILIDFMIDRMTYIVRGMDVHIETMVANQEKRTCK